MCIFHSRRSSPPAQWLSSRAVAIKYILTGRPCLLYKHHDFLKPSSAGSRHFGASPWSTPHSSWKHASSLSMCWWGTRGTSKCLDQSLRWLRNLAFEWNFFFFFAICDIYFSLQNSFSLVFFFLCKIKICGIYLVPFVVSFISGFFFWEREGIPQ